MPASIASDPAGSTQPPSRGRSRGGEPEAAY